LLQDLEELKGTKDQHLERKGELQEEIAGLQKELEAVDAAFREAKANISEVVRKLNKLPRE
jgi:DNA repair exonuclease SbcCD ATPase subunit